MKFGIAQNRKFGTDIGAYSIVTPRENFDSQITLTDFEAELLISFFGKENLRVGNVRGDPHKAEKSFFLHSTGREIHLNLVFPKPEKTELRLYISSEKGFKPERGEVWFMYVKDKRLCIGSMPEISWRTESSSLIIDESDFLYQESLEVTDNIRISTLKQRDVFMRDRGVALKKMEQVGYACEFDPTHSLFISRSTKKKYLEAHHLVPISLQSEFKLSLDTTSNVFCLCPNCHRAVHHAVNPVSRKIIEVLSNKTPVLSAHNLSLDELFSIYSVEEIV